jgi:ABC-type transport system involved in multi-copper enzyme maturation permease subunit
MIRLVRTRRRRGYSLTVVVIFLILLVAIWSTVCFSSSSLLLIETVRVMQQSRDQGPMNVLAQAVQLLQYSTPSDSSNPSRSTFTYGVTVTVSGTNGSCSTNSYVVEFSPAPSQGTNCWQVQVSPGTYSTPLPLPGAVPQWP